MAAVQKAPGAFWTIGELSQELGIAQHILRYWETKFPQLRPLQRAGNRRYYRPADVDLARKIHRLLSQDGYTVRGVQKLLRDRNGSSGMPEPETDEVASSPATVDGPPKIDIARLIAVRERLQAALQD